MTRRVPFTVIGGFLGAGKTTLLNHWLRHAGGQRLAVLVNDFGALNIDAGLIEASAGDTIALTNGCVCCQIGDDLSLALLRVLDSGTPFDAVVVEASGVSDPWRIAQLGRADPRLSLDGVIVLVDASCALAQSRDALLADTLVRQLRAADLIVVNKVELIDSATREELRRWIASHAAKASQFDTCQAEVPIAMLSSAALCVPGVSPSPDQAACCEPGHTATPMHSPDLADPAHGSVFETWSCQPNATFPAQSVKAWLQHTPSGLLRLKGVLRTLEANGESGWSELQFAGRQGTLRRASAPADGAAIVAIALRGQLPTGALSAFFEGSP